jgi:carbamoyltransferase
MVVLGITHVCETNASACIIKDGKLITWVEEERFIRKKNAEHRFPINSIKYCIDTAGVTIDEVDKIAVSWLPTKDTNHVFNENEIGAHTGLIGFEYVQHIGNAVKHLSFDYFMDMCILSLREDFAIMGDNPFLNAEPYPLKNVEYWGHHDCHAMSAILPSGFKNTNFFTCDGAGDLNCGVMGYYTEQSGMNELGYIDHMFTVGGFYAAATEFLGFTPHSHEGKVMGLACYGKVDEERFPLTFSINQDGLLLPNTSEWRLMLFNEANTSLRNKIQENPLCKEGKSFAATTQYYFEKMIIHNIKKLNELNPCDNLVLAGGSFLNCTANGKIAREIPNVYIQPGASDQGTALGAAILSYKKLTGTVPDIKMETAYTGREYSNAEILKVLKEKGINYTYVKDPSVKLAKLISEDNVVGWFQGKAEIGPRALCHRSIIANPTHKYNLKRVNKIKNRENWRPLAPVMLEEYLYDITDATQPSPFMLTAVQVNEEWKTKIPACTHVDNSCRPQSINKTQNPQMYKALKEFYKIGGIPVFMNTSFNVAEEPLVDSPLNAIRTFAKSGLDYLILENYLISKNDNENLIKDIDIIITEEENASPEWYNSWWNFYVKNVPLGENYNKFNGFFTG